MFFASSRLRILKFSWHDYEQYGKDENKKKEHNQHDSVFKVLTQLSYYLNVTDPSIILMILIFLSCREKDHDNNKFSREISKLYCES